MTTHTETLPLSILDGSDGELWVRFSYSPGCPAVWYLSNGDPGYPAEDPEITITEARYIGADGKPQQIAVVGLAPHEEERVVEWLLDHWEPPTGPDPDDARDQHRDDEMTGRGE